MCDKCDEICCLRDSCPGLGGCRLCGKFPSNITHKYHSFPRIPTEFKFSKIPPKRYQKSWLLASKSVWKSDFLCIALWCVAILSVSQAFAQQDTQIATLSNLPTMTTMSTITNSTFHIPEGRSE